MSSYKKVGSDWYTCGCGGKPKEKIEVPANTTAVVFKVFTPTVLQAPTSLVAYLARPNMTALDVDSADAAEFISANQAEEPTSFAMQYQRGYFAKQSLQ